MLYLSLLLLSQQLPTAPFTELLFFAGVSFFFLEKLVTSLHTSCVELLISLEEVPNLQAVPVTNTELRCVCGIVLAVGKACLSAWPCFTHSANQINPPRSQFRASEATPAAETWGLLPVS